MRSILQAGCWLLVLAACSSEDGKPESMDNAPPGETSSDATNMPAASTTAEGEGQGEGDGNGDVNVGGLAPVGSENEPAPSSSTAPTPTSTATPAQPTMGCGSEPALASGENTLTVDGAERTFLVDLPAGYDSSKAYPLVFAFHGATTSGAFFRSARYGNLLSAMGGEAIVVHPTALGDPTAWDNARDVPFFDAMLEQITQGLCVDSTRVFATGHSSGGFFTNTLGCQRGDVLRAIAPVSGGGPFVFGNQRCTGEVAVFLAHGDNDMTVPVTSGEQSRDRWLGFNGCDASATQPATPSECVDYTGCDADLPVRWCVHQDGHNWPAFLPQAIWGFFKGL
jgi:poly(3-hydroxybutyrate) depolymerase